jgi:hypothetical protein
MQYPSLVNTVTNRMEILNPGTTLKDLRNSYPTCYVMEAGSSKVYRKDDFTFENNKQYILKIGIYF